MGEKEIAFGQMVVSAVRSWNPMTRGIALAPEMNVEIKKFAPKLDVKEMLFSSNAASLNTGSELVIGMAADMNCFYYRNNKNQETALSFCWRDIENAQFRGKNLFGSYSPGDTVLVRLKNGGTVELSQCMTGCDCTKVEGLLNLVAKQKISQDMKEWETQTLSLDEQPEGILLAYMKILYNYAFISGQQVENTELSALQSIGVRLGLEAPVRSKLKYYLLHITEQRENTGRLMQQCKESMSFGSYELYRFSLMQDALYLRENNDETAPWYEDAFLNSLQQKLEISDDQVEVMLVAVRMHRAFQEKNADLQQLDRNMKDIFKQAEKQLIPKEAVFCSGSVYNIDTFHGLFKKRKQEISIQQQRELMLQTVVRNCQQVSNHLAEDMNDTVLRVMEEIQKGNERSESIHSMQVYLERLQKQDLALVQKCRDMEREIAYGKLLNILDECTVNRLSELQRELVSQCYVYLANGTYRIKNDLTVRQLKALRRIEEIVNETDN